MSYDYTQDCVSSGSCECDAVIYLIDGWVWGCITVSSSCACACPDALPNSSLVDEDCSVWGECPEYPNCDDWCNCRCDGGSATGLCYYKCDDGYEWDGEQCVPIVVEMPFAGTTGLQPLLLNMIFGYFGIVKKRRWRRRKKLLLCYA